MTSIELLYHLVWFIVIVSPSASEKLNPPVRLPAVLLFESSEVKFTVETVGAVFAIVRFDELLHELQSVPSYPLIPNIQVSPPVVFPDPIEVRLAKEVTSIELLYHLVWFIVIVSPSTSEKLNPPVRLPAVLLFVSSEVKFTFETVGAVFWPSVIFSCLFQLN